MILMYFTERPYRDVPEDDRASILNRSTSNVIPAKARIQPSLYIWNTDGCLGAGSRRHDGTRRQTSKIQNIERAFADASLQRFDQLADVSPQPSKCSLTL